MNCLDTYALIEIIKSNPAYAEVIKSDFVISDFTLGEFYWVLLRDFSEEEAHKWALKFSAYSKSISQTAILNAITYKFHNKKQNLSFFDCIGYSFAKENGFVFVTGDKEFKDKENVLFIK